MVASWSLSQSCFFPQPNPLHQLGRSQASVKNEATSAGVLSTTVSQLCQLTQHLDSKRLPFHSISYSQYQNVSNMILIQLASPVSPPYPKCHFQQTDRQPHVFFPPKTLVCKFRKGPVNLGPPYDVRSCSRFKGLRSPGFLGIYSWQLVFYMNHWVFQGSLEKNIYSYDICI